MVDIAGLVPVRRAVPWSRWRSRRGDAASGGAAPGVRATAAALGGLDASRWHVVADPDLALLPEPELSRGERMPVDHLVVGPPGVLVVASRSWNGSIRTTHGVLRQDGARRERDLAEVARAADAVRVAYELDEDVPVIGVLCFVPPAMVTGWIGEVLLCATGDVVAVLDRLSRRLDREQVDAVAAHFTPVGQDTAQEDGQDLEVPAVPAVPAVSAAAVVLDEAWAEPQAGA